MKKSVLVLIKPDALSKSLAGDVIKQLDQTGLRLMAIKRVQVTEALAAEHYSNIKGTPFYDEVIQFITGQFHGGLPVIAMVYRGEDPINVLRTLAGATNPEEADPRSLRGAFGRIKTNGLFENVLHVSSSPEDAEREVKLWFSPEELPADVYGDEAVKEEAIQRKVWA